MNKHRELFITVFLTGACVMVVEITASRVIAPYFGASLYVWTNVIAVILAALALGYWIGGRLAENTKSKKVLSEIILGAGFATISVPFLFKGLASLVTRVLLALHSSGATIVFTGSLVVLVFLFALPIVLLGTVSPFVIRLVTMDEADVGSVSGRVFAIGTLGSLFGTFLPTLLLVPTIGSARTIFLSGSVLIVLGGYGLVKQKRALVFLSLCLCVAVFSIPKTLRARPGFLYEQESPFQYLSVQDQPNLGRTLVFNEGLGIQSLVRVDGKKSGYYWDYIPPLLGTTASSSVKEMLMIGVAGATIPKQIEADWMRRVRVTGVEIDAAVLRVARQYFGLTESGVFTSVLQDGRVFLAHTDQKYDFILVDAFTNQLYIPPHLSTVEFFTLVRNHLSSHGTFSLNIAVAKEHSMLYERLVGSLKAVFPHVYSMKLHTSMNWVVVASIEEKDWAELQNQVPATEKDLARLIGQEMKEIQQTKGELLTDDKSPIELLTDKEVFDGLMREKE